MEFILIRTFFISLLSFDFLNSIKVFHLPIGFPWLVLFLICLGSWLFWEKVYKKRFNFPTIMGGLFAFQISADTLGNALYLYRKFDWYDKFTHFTGGATAGALMILVLSYLSRKNHWRISLKTLIIFAVSLALLFGVFYEFWEYFAYSILGYKFIITGLTDTAHDLLFDFLGIMVAILIFTAMLKKKGYLLPNASDSNAK